MRIFYTFCILFCFTISPVFGQHLVNGSFEGKSTTIPCNGILLDKYDEDMNNSGCAFGDTLIDPSQPGGGVPSIFYLDKNCGEGNPHKGKTFIGISAVTGKTDKISMLLDTGTINWYGRKYTLIYWFKKPANGSAIKLYIGCSSDCNSFGTPIDTLAAPADSSWKSDTVTFLPPADTKYITVMGEGNSATTREFTFIDDFSFTPDIVGVNNINLTNNISIYPNPFSTATGITLAENVKLPCNLAIYDVTGRMVYRQNGINSHQIPLDRGQMNSGAFILKITDGDNNTGTSRLIIQ